MPIATKPSARPTLATLSAQWLVLIVITLATIVSSIGLTSSHGIAVTEATHNSVVPFSESAHGQVHADQGIEVPVADENSSGGHPHHALDHSHDTAHQLPLAWGTISQPPPSWEMAVRQWMDMGQAYRLDRPPMG